MVRQLAPRAVPVERPTRRSPRARRLVLLACTVLAAGLALWLWGRRDDVEEVVRTAVVRSHLPRVESHAAWIVEAANESRVDPNLLAAIMLSESGGDVGAVSHANALGLFQLMLPTAQERARRMRLAEPTREELLEDGRLNTRLAAHYVRWLERRYDGHLEKMLIAYNAGPGRLERWIREAGGYHAWRAERDAAGDSGVLRYAAKVSRYRGVFAERGRIASVCDHPPAPVQPELEPSATELFGPPPSPAHVDQLPLLARPTP
ncbi:MAG TPA: transglycosylase SLT domain-containing protein [Planctomycetota bacterium]|nr:transglycosylase SLT domain-containing protein [Planctomycetota bacterium]